MSFALSFSLILSKSWSLSFLSLSLLYAFSSFHTFFFSLPIFATLSLSYCFIKPFLQHAAKVSALLQDNQTWNGFSHLNLIGKNGPISEIRLETYRCYEDNANPNKVLSWNWTSWKASLLPCAWFSQSVSNPWGHYVRQESLALLFSNQSRLRLCSILHVGGNCGRERLQNERNAWTPPNLFLKGDLLSACSQCL